MNTLIKLLIVLCLLPVAIATVVVTLFYGSLLIGL